MKHTGIIALTAAVQRFLVSAEEVYIPLTGQTHWQQGNQGWTLHPLGQPIFHAPWVPHAIKTGAPPLLALYLWRAGDLTQKSLFG
jgi:hypothetical protein